MSNIVDAPVQDDPGRFGQYGGRFVPETLISALDELTEVYAEASADPADTALEILAEVRDRLRRKAA